MSVSSTITSAASTTLATSISSIIATSTTSDTGSTPTPEPEATSIYFYHPSLPLSIVFSVLYFILVPWHFYLSIYKPHISKSTHQKHKYTIPLFVAAVISTLGFSLRIASVSSPSGRASVALYASSSTWIIIAPIFICATLYLLLKHLISACLPEGRPRVFAGLNPRWLGRIFIASDVLSFLCQCSGSGIAASQDIGTAVLIFGLAAQLATFSVYLVLLTLFCRRVTNGHTDVTLENHAAEEVPTNATTSTAPPPRRTLAQPRTRTRDFGFNPLTTHVLRGVWAASILIEIRSIYRLTEFATGITGYLFVHEWPLWWFEATPVWIALVALALCHPVSWLQGRRRSAFLEKA